MRKVWQMSAVLVAAALLLSGCGFFGGESASKTVQPVTAPRNEQVSEPAQDGSTGSGSGTDSYDGGGDGSAESTGSGTAGAAPDDRPTLVTSEVNFTLPGDVDALTRTLQMRSPVRYEILVVKNQKVADKTGYLDRVLAERDWPEPNMLVLVVFPESNFDIRFAMGADFGARDVSVEEMLNLVRTVYFPKVREGDPAAGLAFLVERVNRRMAQ